ncbi:lysozyme [Acinetobacter sp. GN11]
MSSFEDTRIKAYDDGVGVWTIGTGTTIYPNGFKVKKGDTCTPEQAKAYFKHDLAKFEKTVNESVTVSLTQNQFDALVSLTYNIGSGAFKNSTLLKLLNKGDLLGAADQFLVWNKAGGKVMKGLVRRREAERALFLKK